MALPSANTSTYESVLDICTNTLMSQVRNYTEDQLQGLLSDEDRLSAMVDSMPQVSSLVTDKELKLAQCKSFAEYNLSIEPKLREGAARLKATSDSVLREKQEVEQLKSRLDSIAEDRSLDSISAILQAAVQEAEDDSESIAEQFQDGKLEIDEFIKQFDEKRLLAHTRKIKSEKLTEIIRQQQYQPIPNQNSYAHPYPSGYGSRVQGQDPNVNYRHSYFR
ncbi:modifier of rudimentary (Mod(r)) protein domain-containing protein [Ditylenchus destructor]|uniref:Modifier of rudimentary (Mod(R)) protein domain-containing protein n=1 Tax=Ditylenchus destructor TaxID=166010 RepID=A0AAD4MQV5_9BILA|nr:modifier of rudimentary (Mod(r)) protein domain-containing protein [Ditylenchus destructor]